MAIYTPYEYDVLCDDGENFPGEVAEALTDDDLHEMYDTRLDEYNAVVWVGSLNYTPSQVLKAVDPIAYRTGFSDWLDAEIQEGNLIEA